ncbi:helix-turn-helix domain-containing protein [Nostoc favosum]|uniref:Helix-turn-helix domain-containing protein n=1 Tax=Nostoc favosum CHAB5714 TaxID=2780399 RepID=A0ABS8IKL3_9NOSO|nr:helix-turn-helix transcriptional regulator [Nostoc favosum]MCC5604810.1 helix-turn-helix domain-containing protein [Nostoc favosum CHAB5714]
MANHQQILIDAVNKAIIDGMTARQVATAAGVDNSVLSRFLNGKQDIKSGDYFSILEALPESVKLNALTQLGASKISVVQLIETANEEEIDAVLLTIGRKWKTSKQNASISGDYSPSAIAV